MLYPGEPVHLQPVSDFQPLMKHHPTLADVARAAGVSKTTASMALNGKGLTKIPDATRERVLNAAGTLQYRPHGLARALTRRRADVLGVVCKVSPFIERAHHAFEQGLLSAIFGRALERGYNPLIYGYPPDGAGDREILRYADGRSDAFILLNPPTGSDLVRYLHGAGTPTVTVLSRDTDPRGRWVDSDHEGGIRASVAHLADLGHRRIAYLIGPRTEDVVNRRVTAFCEALDERGLPARADWILPHTWDVVGTGEHLDRLLADPHPPTAILTWYDTAAEDLFRAARMRGLRIPEDLSVIGFDDMPAARSMVPALTTVRQDPDMVGKAAVDLALDALCEPNTPGKMRQVVCPVELVVRQSTSVPGQPARHKIHVV
jgi:DNA-binding LacI/PurR family transcriptional regulator